MTTYAALSDIPDQSGRTATVTGANSGLGEATARGLAAAGAHVVLAVRDTAKGRVAAGSMTGDTEVRELDLSRLDSVRAFAASWEGPLDLLINNAGVMMPPYGRTADGFETQFGVNHLGHFALTNLLLPAITGRVVTVSSTAHRGGKIDFDDLQWERRRYMATRAYGQSKLANLLFTLELQRRLAEVDSSVLATAAHPGYAATNLTSSSRNPVFRLVTMVGDRVLAQSAEGGAMPTLYAALADLPPMAFTGPGGFKEQRGTPPRMVGRSGAAVDEAVARRLWDVSEQLTGTAFPLAAPVTAD